MTDVINTVFGQYSSASRGRLDLTYDYETAAIFSFKKILAQIEASVLLDIGANIGVYSIFCSDVPSLQKVHAFEPAPATYSILSENIGIQTKRHAPFFKVHQIAASSKSDVVPFKIVAPTSGANAIVDMKQEGQEYIDVRAMPLDSLLNFRGNRIAVKIDVEGHEAATIAGMEELLSNNDCYIQVEALRDDRTAQIKCLLQDLGYDYVFSLRDDHLFLHKNLHFYFKPVLAILANAVSSDLRDLMNLRREKRAVAISARKLREQSMYKKDPIFLPEGDDPFRY